MKDSLRQVTGDVALSTPRRPAVPAIGFDGG